MSATRLNVPTILTFSRIFLIPFFIIATPLNPFLGASIFLVASVTDLLDGYLARKLDQVTKFGIILDPIADKFLIISAMILLVVMTELPAWIAVVIVVREIIIIGLRFAALLRNIVIPAVTGGKLKTISQMIAIVLLILPGGVGSIDFHDVGIVVMYMAVILALVSGIKYIVSFWWQIQ
ncbi:CDP-diacylglycerol--glycerol-3-phosphate 3-phosphatidyltransferase [Thermodesulfovibrionales bacterium]|nr:CDP-diacylglycerol--glycerol-3-phosphate 3-phosphatidyltransferase [Thermodesulfovibrionales bacterium]